MIITESIEYGDEHGQYEGLLVYPDNAAGKLPCVLVAPTVWGRTSMEESSAKKLAEMGYVAMIVDLYGKGFDASTEAAAFGKMAEFNADRQFLLNRMQFIYKTASQLPQVDESKVAGIGFCFGGKCLLDLARSGYDFAGAVSFHGVFDAPSFNPDQKITTPLLLLHGWDDPLATPDDVLALTKELTHKGANWELDAYGHTGHAFMKPEANRHEAGYFYHAEVADRAWNRMADFLKIALE
jgi:dienelactone hydrolase